MLAAGTAEALQRVAADVVAFWIETCLMALAMLATATRRKPSATARGSCVAPEARESSGPPVAASMSAARAANFSATTAASSGASPSGPNRLGKWRGWILPTMTLASVTVSGPPRR